MKQFLCLFIVFSLLLALSGCLFREETGVPVPFYYLREEDRYVYGSSDGVVTFEERDCSGHVGDIKYLLTLYLQGPLTEGLTSPFPSGCKLVELSRRESELYVTLNARFTTLKGMEQTLACVCLARTCMSLVKVSTVHIQAETTGGQTSSIQTITLESLRLEN